MSNREDGYSEHSGFAGAGPLRFAVVENLVHIAWGRGGEPSAGGMYLTPQQAVAVAEDLHHHAETAAARTIISDTEGPE